MTSTSSSSSSTLLVLFTLLLTVTLALAVTAAPAPALAPAHDLPLERRGGIEDIQRKCFEKCHAENQAKYNACAKSVSYLQVL
ncbi:hypothetical protein FBU30_004080 [Linnemannia zychae]|nr:hypothetical protein FBU30_004080 [Linnemannia zychae]